MFICHELTRGGAERQLMTLTLGLQERGWQTAVAVFRTGGGFEEPLRAASIPILELGYGGKLTIPGFLWRLRNAVRTHRPAVIHGYMDLSNVLVSLAGAFDKHRKVVWGVRASALEFDRYDPSRRFYDRLATWFSGTADLIIANSRSGREHHVKLGYPSERVFVVPNGIDTQQFEPDVVARERTREELGMAPRASLIGIVARLDPMKDHRTFLRAAAEVREREPHTVFACVGDGPPSLRDELQTFASKLGLAEHLLWLGPRDDMVALYNAFDVTCLASAFGEGFPNVVGESMACGTPCVVTDVGDSALLVGDTGEVVPPREPHQLASAIVRTIASLRDDQRSISAATRARIVGEFRLDHMVDRTEALLESLIGVAPTRSDRPSENTSSPPG